MMKKQIVGAISMYEAGRIGGRLQELRLRSSQELRCVNLMCEKVGNPCICRLAKVLSRTLNLELLDLANNNLSDLPSEIWNLKKLRVLDLSGNQLKSLPFDDGIQKLPNLETLNFEGNPIKADLMKIQEFLKGRIRKKDT